MGLDLKQLQQSLGIAKDYSDKELSDAERRIEILIESLYEVIRNEREDPLRVLDDNTGIEDNPIGHIMAFMGTKAPRHYLVCDGSVFNIADYPMLSQHMIDQFGSINYFGGNGTSTFAVPDLRGEFLRGSGTNGHTNQGNGANVGAHQDATIHPPFWANGNSCYTRDGSGPTSQDYAHMTNTRTQYVFGIRSTIGGTVDGSSGSKPYTSRPTNTSVLYCIKYEPTYYIRTGPDAYHYKAEETRIGTWKDGLPLYRQIVEMKGPIGNRKSVTLDIGPASTSKIVKMSATLRGYLTNTNWGTGLVYTNTNGEVLDYWYNQDEKKLYADAKGSYTNDTGTIIIEILYTKTS